MFWRPSDIAAAHLQADLSCRSVSYAEVGATRELTLPTGYHHDARSVSLGRGDNAFQQGQEALRHWVGHRHAGAVLTPADPSLVQGTDLVVMLRRGLIFVLAPCRIVYVTDEADRFGFAYGTLPGHPERGEEAFHIARSGSEVSFEITAFSHPAALLARLGSPIARAIQLRVTEAYLEGVRRFVVGR
jgi:uncharacterized protein (UPF0548 family)